MAQRLGNPDGRAFRGMKEHSRPATQIQFAAQGHPETGRPSRQLMANDSLISHKYARGVQNMHPKRCNMINALALRRRCTYAGDKQWRGI